MNAAQAYASMKRSQIFNMASRGGIKFAEERIADDGKYAGESLEPPNETAIESSGGRNPASISGEGQPCKPCVLSGWSLEKTG